MPTSKETNRIESLSITKTGQIHAMIIQLESTLHNQHRILQQRGMTLPPGTLQDVGSIKDSLSALAASLHVQQVELGRLKALAETANLITSTLSLDAVLNNVMDTAIQLTGAERGYIVLREPPSMELEVRVARNLDQETIDKGSFIVSRSVVNEVAASGRPVVTTNAQNDPRFANQESVVSYALRSILCVPLKVKDVVTGVVYVDNRIRAGLFGESELALLLAFANQSAEAIEHARLFGRVRATLEEVTGHKELLENVFASIASGVITTDTQGTVIICNQAARRILNLDRATVLNRPLREVLPPLGDTFFEAATLALDTGQQQSLELEPEIPGRGKVVMNLRLSPLKTPDDTTNGITILLDDLTDIRRREATLAEVRRYLPPAMVENIREIDTIELGGEEREISVILADVRGFTRFSEQLEPEALMTIINRYLEVSSDAIHLYEGIVDKYMGDAVVGLYNTQLNPQENDHALRAVRAAMSMLYDVQALHELLPSEYQLWYGIGIDTGSAVLGNVGSQERKEFTALGKPLNYAKKLQEAAERGEILISEETYDRIKNRIEAQQVERTFRGEDTPRTMYKVVGFRRK